MFKNTQNTRKVWVVGYFQIRLDLQKWINEYEEAEFAQIILILIIAHQCANGLV